MTNRKCSHCKAKHPATEMFHRGIKAFCNSECWISFVTSESESKRLIKKGNAIRRKESNKAHREAKERIKTRSQWMNEAQVWVNRFIRLRDKGLPCISCGRVMNEGGYVGAGGIHAGHYRSRGACPELRFHEDNIHAQCAQCNNENSGNQIMYRKGLIKKIGIEKVEWIEGPHDPKKYTIDELKELIATYKAKVKAL